MNTEGEGDNFWNYLKMPLAIITYGVFFKFCKGPPNSQHVAGTVLCCSGRIFDQKDGEGKAQVLLREHKYAHHFSHAEQAWLSQDLTQE